jgi:hypothetical protein
MAKCYWEENNNKKCNMGQMLQAVLEKKLRPTAVLDTNDLT